MKHFQLKRLLGEIAPKIRNARLQKIYQPDESDLQLVLYSARRKHFLTIRTAPGLVSCYLALERTGEIGEAAGDYCMKLRARLQGTALEAIEQVENDRIIHFSFVAKSAEKSTLVAELFSTAANCFLLDHTGRIVAVMNQAAARGRDNLPGGQYTAPAPSAEVTMLKTEEDPLARLMAEKGLEDYNAAVREHYEQLAAKKRIDGEKSIIRRALSRERKRLERLRSTHEQTVAQAGNLDRYRENAEILSANFRSLKKGQNMIHLPDLFAQDRAVNREIPLDPALLPQENIERYYKKYKKLKSGIKYARAHLVEVKCELDRLENLMVRLEGASGEEEISKIAGKAGVSIDSARSSAGSGKVRIRLPYRRFRAADGSLIMVGKGPKDNDELTFHIARGNDLWLHISSAPGAHVVLSCPREGMFSGEALLDAAHLALFYSSLKDEQTADVDYAHRKYISRPKSGTPGKAVMSSRKTLHLRVDMKRLERLLGREKTHTV